jgi:hypothetical protein
MIATELEVQQLTSTDIQDNVARTAAKPSSKASKADTPVRVFHHLPIKDIPVNGSTMCECGIRTRNCRRHGSKYFCEHGQSKYRCRECGTGHCQHGRQKHSCRECGTGICEHGLQKQKCKECGNGHCQHGRQKHQCRECGTTGPLTTADTEAAIAFFGGGGGASGPIVGTASVGRHGTKRQAVGSEQHLCAKRGSPSETWECSVCTLINDKPLAPVCVACGSGRWIQA